MMPVKADLGICTYVAQSMMCLDSAIECGFHVKLDFSTCTIMSGFCKSSHILVLK